MMTDEGSRVEVEEERMRWSMRKGIALGVLSSCP
jgi:hypothetical protein